MTRRYAVVFVLGLVAVALLGMPSVAAQETGTPTAAANESTDDGGLGAQLTAFLQSSSAAANDTVKNGMWRAGFDNANESQRARMVTNRANGLERRLERLEDRNQTLRERYENGSLTRQAYVAQTSQLSAQMSGLRAAIDDTDDAATSADVNETRLDELRENASRLSGPRVAELARENSRGPSVEVDRENETAARKVVEDRPEVSSRGNASAVGDQGPPTAVSTHADGREGPVAPGNRGGDGPQVDADGRNSTGGDDRTDQRGAASEMDAVTAERPPAPGPTNSSGGVAVGERGNGRNESVRGTGNDTAASGRPD
ncbi:hypothetical protein [Haloarcula marina]|uniref:hypothetical protein n=1 Tax=Haloarcula marina TaxID=2961574 RepID=UPI0020B641E6|nr:hypothetical protein [Halomicroarcula marina]